MPTQMNVDVPSGGNLPAMSDPILYDKWKSLCPFLYDFFVNHKLAVSTHRACAAPRAALHPLAPILSPRPLPHTHDLPTDTNTHLSIHLFMQACLRDTLRLYSAVAAFQRECVKETIIKASDGKKYKFHAGQKVSTRSRARKHAFLQY